jgi:molybdenum cofactor guanylyltransferase
MFNVTLMSISCAILAGGQSKRMGRDKATISIGEMRLIEHVFVKVRPIFDDILVISSHHDSIQGIDAPVFGDVLPYRSPLVGIISALLYSRTPYVFVVACDMPFLDKGLILSMIQEIRGEDVIIPKTVVGYEALHAIYNRSCLSPMLSLVDAGRFRVRDVFPFVNMRAVSVDSISVFTNVNTEKDLEQVRELL